MHNIRNGELPRIDSSSHDGMSFVNLHSVEEWGIIKYDMNIHDYAHIIMESIRHAGHRVVEYNRDEIERIYRMKIVVTKNNNTVSVRITTGDNEVRNMLRKNKRDIERILLKPNSGALIRLRIC